MDYTDDLELALPIQGYTNWHSPVNSNFTTIDTKLGKAYQNVWNEGDVTYITNNAKYVTDHWERWNTSKAASLVKIENTGTVTNYHCSAGTGTIVWIEDIFGDGSDGAVTLSSDTDMGGIYNYTTFDDGENTITTTDSCLIIRATISITISGEIDASGKGGDGGSRAHMIYVQYTPYYDTFQSSGLKGILDLNSTFVLNLSKVDINNNNIYNFIGMIGGSGGDGGNARIFAGYNSYGGDGGNGGGIVILIAPTITITGTINASGNNGGGGATQYGCVAYGGNGGDGGLIILGYSTLDEASAVYNVDGGIGGTPTGVGSNIAGSIGSDGIIKKIEV